MSELKKRLSTEAMEKTTGGTMPEWYAYCDYLAAKYKTKDYDVYYNKCTWEERHYMYLIQNHKKGEPMPECPNPDFVLKDWM